MTARPRPPSVPGWEVLGLLGSGGMGHVWKARRADGTVAALKVVRPLDSVSPAEVASLFRREALACLHLDHPNLVRAFDAGLTADGAAYLALEFVEGRTLLAALVAEGALDESRVLEIGVALTRALAEVHRLGLVHRDVTPRNVMLTADGRVKLLDLGLVVEAKEGGGAHSMGTAGFVAPEVAAGRRPDARADLYSLGATLAAAATGELPGGEALAGRTDLSRSIRRKRMSPGLRQVVQRLLHDDPERRYATAAELALDLEALAAGERPLGAILGESGARVVRRWPRVAAGVAIAAVAGVGLWWGLRAGGATAERPDGDAPDVLPRAVDRLADAAPRNPALEAARVFVERFPDDFARGRALLTEAESAALDAADREELARLRRALDERFTAAADREHAERSRRLRAAAEAGDVPEARRIAGGWPEALRESPRAAELSRAAGEAAAVLARENEALAADADRFIRTALEVTEETAAQPSTAALTPAGDDLGRRVEATLARPAFDGDRREGLLDVRRRLDAATARLATARLGGEALARWRSALAAHVEKPSPARLRDALAAGAEEHVPQATRDDVRAVSAALERAETWVTSRLTMLKGREWWGPRGDMLACTRIESPPTGDEVYLAPHWRASGGRAPALVSGAKGSEEGAAWLLSRGLLVEALDAGGPESAVARLLRLTSLREPETVVSIHWPVDFLESIALREVGTRATVRPTTDPVATAWAAATAGGTPAAPVPAARNPAKAEGRDAFLDGNLERAARALADAAAADPRDAEVAALRGRTWLAAARPLPTAPALLAAFSEGRRAWDLDPRLPAGPILTAEAGLELLAVAGPACADRVRPVVVAACDAAESLGRADARMLLFAGEQHLLAGRSAKAATHLRRASALAPDSGPAALLLARAEHACGRSEKAREALRRARDLFGKTLPPEAADLAKALGL